MKPKLDWVIHLVKNGVACACCGEVENGFVQYEDLLDKIISVIYIKLYLDYDLCIDFYPQFVKNADGCVEMLKTLLSMPIEEAV